MSTELILGALGVLFVIVGIVFIVRVRSFLRGAAEARGRVVKLVKVSSSSGGETSNSTHAMVEYTTADGQATTFMEKSQTFGGLKAGSEVPVRYDPAQPAKARISTRGRLWATPIGFIAAGVGLVVAAVIVAVVNRGS